MGEIRLCTVVLVCMVLSVLLAAHCCADGAEDDGDFYSLLGLDRSATTKDIRKGFKKVALKMHPDKNMDDPDADAKFIRINRAYEVLKDDDKRKIYDQFGEEGLEDKQSGRGYHSWSYYKDNFGIYDDDPEIITLSRTDFEGSVSNSQTPWFINYYHPMCSHCHTLAPDWRWLSIELQGVVRIGAVNCDDEYHLCAEQGVGGYPSLLAYPGRDRFHLEKTRENLVSFILGRLPTGLGIPVTTGMLHNMRQQHKLKSQQKERKAEAVAASVGQQPWLLAVFHSTEDMADYRITLMKLAAIFSGIVKVGRVDCTLDPGVCKTLDVSEPQQLQSPGGSEDDTGHYSSPLRYYSDIPVLGGGLAVRGETAQDAAKEVLDLMPEIPLIGADQYKTLHDAMVRRESSYTGWLVQFTSEGDHQDQEYRKVAGLVSESIPVHRVLCSSSQDCDALYIHKTPAFVLFKPGGGYEVHQGRLLAQDIANFAREAAAASHFRTLTPKEFPSMLSHSSHWFVDFYAPWCPPCMRLLPQFRKASVAMQQHALNTTVNFGIIDCTTHSSLCSHFNVRSYPTTILYNHTTPHQYSGHHTPHHIVEFVKDTLNPTVVVLTPDTFQRLVLGRDPSQLWVVDFFASWCGPCQAMAPEYRKFGRQVRDMSNVFVGTLDCAEHRDYCAKQRVNSYPTIRLYGGGGRIGAPSFSEYSDHNRNAPSFKTWLYSHLPSKVTILNDRTFEEVLRSGEPWLVDFFAPWCGHCHQFAPDFEDLARTLDGSVRFGKVDCQSYQWLCRGASVSAYPTVVFYRGTNPDARQQSARGGGGDRQNPRGEQVESLDPEYILSHVKWRLQELGNEEGRRTGGRARDEL